MIIEKPKPEDAEIIHDLVKRSWYDTYINNDIGVTREDINAIYLDDEGGQIEKLKSRIISPKESEILFVAKEEGKVIGFLRLRIEAEQAELVALYADPDYYGKGVGTLLWQQALKEIPDSLPVTVELADYTKAKDFYKKIGFVDTGERYTKDDSIMKISGTRMPLMKMIFRK